MIEIDKLCKSFGEKVVLNNVDLKIDDGKVLGLVGINGAGKSTLLRILCGVYKSDSGSILVDGKESYDNEEVKKDFFFLPDDPYYDFNSTPNSILKLYEALYKVDRDKYFELLEHFKINPKLKINKFSKGMKRQTFISLALAIHPKYLVLDEAFDGLDPLARLKFKRELIDIIEDYNSTVIISSHSLRELEDICDSFALLDKNHIVSSGNLSEALEEIHKYQIAFPEAITKEAFPRIYKSFSSDGRVVKITTSLKYEEVEEKIKDLNPIFIDELSVDFEEMFEAVVEEGGYLAWKAYFVITLKKEFRYYQ